MIRFFIKVFVVYKDLYAPHVDASQGSDLGTT